MPITKKRLHGIKKKNNQSHKKKSMSRRDKRQHTRKQRKSIHLRNKSLKGGDQKRKKAAAARKQKAKSDRQQSKKQKKIKDKKDKKAKEAKEVVARKQVKTPSTLALPAPKPTLTTKPIVSSNKLEKSIVPIKAKDVKMVTGPPLPKRPTSTGPSKPKSKPTSTGPSKPESKPTSQTLKNFCNDFKCDKDETAKKCRDRNQLKGPYRHPDKGGNTEDNKKLNTAYKNLKEEQKEKCPISQKAPKPTTPKPTTPKPTTLALTASKPPSPPGPAPKPGQLKTVSTPIKSFKVLPEFYPFNNKSFVSVYKAWYIRNYRGKPLKLLNDKLTRKDFENNYTRWFSRVSLKDPKYKNLSTPSKQVIMKNTKTISDYEKEIEKLKKITPKPGPTISKKPVTPKTTSTPRSLTEKEKEIEKLKKVTDKSVHTIPKKPVTKRRPPPATPVRKEEEKQPSRPVQKKQPSKIPPPPGPAPNLFHPSERKQPSKIPPTPPTNGDKAPAPSFPVKITSKPLKVSSDNKTISIVIDVELPREAQANTLVNTGNTVEEQMAISASGKQ